MTNKRLENELAEELREYKDGLRQRLLPFTRKAFGMMTGAKNPSILDIGCGSGIPTLELVRMGAAHVTGIETDQVQLDRLAKKAKETGVSDRVTLINRSMMAMDFPIGGFDVIWAEGSIAAIGFERGLRKWSPFLKSDGYLVLHDELKDFKKKLRLIPRRGYDLIGHFNISEDVWRDAYFEPLGQKLKEIRSRYGNGDGVSELLADEQRDVDGLQKDPRRCRSVFYVMKKR